MTARDFFDQRTWRIDRYILYQASAIAATGARKALARVIDDELLRIRPAGLEDLSSGAWMSPLEPMTGACRDAICGGAPPSTFLRTIRCWGD